MCKTIKILPKTFNVCTEFNDLCRTQNTKNFNHGKQTKYSYDTHNITINISPKDEERLGE